jgi:hypothetical protein
VNRFCGCPAIGFALSSNPRFSSTLDATIRCLWDYQVSRLACHWWRMCVEIDGFAPEMIRVLTSNCARTPAGIGEVSWSR